MDAPLTETEIDEGGTPPNDSERLAKVHELAMQRFDSVAEPQAEMRAASLEDRRFVTVPGAQWEGPLGEQWENAPRPEVDKITKGIEKIELDYRDNRMMADFVPTGDASDEDTAAMLDGMFRADAYHYKAPQAWDNAFQEAIRGGFGAWRLATDYADEYDPDNDEQRVNPGITIVDADQSVYFDGASKLYDASDAKWAFVVSADPRAVIEDRWGADQTDWPLVQQRWYDWYTPDVIRTAEYYVVEDSADKLHVFTNKLTDEEQRFFASEQPAKDAADLVTQGWTKRTRSVKRRRIRKYILSGSQVLKDCGYIAGSCIPIVPVYGRRLWVDNMPRWEGYVRKRKDPQRMFNAGLARLTETDSRAPYEVPIVNVDQLTPDLAEEWARANIDRLPFLRMMPALGPDGQVLTQGPVGKIEAPQVAPTTAAILQLTLQILTGDDDNTDQVQANVSGDAMEIAKATIDAKSGIFIDNARQSHQRGAEIYLQQAREVYYEPGRKVDTLTEDGQDGQATLSEPHLDPATQVYSIRNDLSQGKYKVVADVQEATATRRAKTVKEALNIAAVATQAQAMDVAQAAILVAIQQMDGEGMTDMQLFARHKAIGLGVTKPTAEEQQEIAQQQASQGQQPPAPADQALMATAGAQAAQAQKFQAEAGRAQADSILKLAQAHALGGPEQAPKPPTGLEPANDAAQVADTAASAQLKQAQAAKIVHDIHGSRIMNDHQQMMDRQKQQLAERQQDHIEAQPSAA